MEQTTWIVAVGVALALGACQPSVREPGDPGAQGRAESAHPESTEQPVPPEPHPDFQHVSGTSEHQGSAAGNSADSPEAP